VLIVTKTTDDGNSEEQSLCLLTTIETGYNALWATGTAYALGDNVRVNGNIYRCIQAGTSALSGDGPTGKSAAIADGSIVWQWINDGAIGAKVGLYNEVVVKPGAGDSWAQANNFEIDAGVIARFLVNTEFDLTNNCGTDSEIGGLNKYCLYVVAQGDNTSTAFIELTTNAAQGVPAAMWGIHTAPGTMLVSNAVIGIDTSAPIGIGFGTEAGGATDPMFSDAAIKCESIAPASLRAVGTYSEAAVALGGDGPAGVALSGIYTLAGLREGSAAPTGLLLEGVYEDWQIFGEGFSVDPLGGIIANGIRLPTPPNSYADDAAAAGGGVLVGEFYRTGSDVKMRVA
jgi:hypothetical protein